MKNKIKVQELIIILVAILILGGITYKQFDLAAAKSRDIDRKNSLNEVGLTIRLFYADYGKLPDEKMINGLWGKEWRDGDYIYLKKMPQENYLEKEYCYLVESDGKNFSLLADMENTSDIECQKNKWSCGGENYCYRRLMEAEVEKR